MYKSISLFFILITGFNSPVSYCTDTIKPITGVRFKRTIPLGDIRAYDTIVSAYDVYHSGNLVQYRVTVHFSSMQNKAVDTTEIRSDYFVYDKDSTFGIQFKGYFDYLGIGSTRMPVDSGFYGSNDYFPTFEDEKDRKPDSSYWLARSRLVNIYNLQETDQCPEKISYHYWYSDEFKDVPETYSKKFDMAKGLKLFKVVLHMHGGYYEKQKTYTSEREYVFEMQRPSSDELKVAEGYFKRYSQLQEKMRSGATQTCN